MRSFGPLFYALLLLVSAALTLPGCRRPSALHLTGGDTFAEMRTIKGDVKVTELAQTKRVPYPRERLADGAVIDLGEGALVWIRRDGGAVCLVAGPASLTMRPDSVNLARGRAFVDGEDLPPVRIDGPRGTLELGNARASVEVSGDGTEDVYVLRGSVRGGPGGERAVPGERLTWKPDGSVARGPAVAWEDWTGGLATADPAAQPAPFGLGTVGARPPGDKGKPRFSLVIERLDVRVTIDRDFAVTEVDQTFVNPSASTVEGIFSFRTPPGAVLHRFGVDRDGAIVWGKVKESAAAKAQYERNVYEGSTEDPALLSWVSPGVYNARLYPIQAGARRRVVTRYAEWLSRQGPSADRRLYVYPMAAEGARGTLPRIEELRVSLDLAKAGATRVRAGMNGKTQGTDVVIQAFDFVPKADLAVELYDAGEPDPVAYRAPHALSESDVPMNAGPAFAARVSAEEPDYLLVPIRSPEGTGDGANGALDLAIVVDTSAATEPGALAIARSLTAALLAHLGPNDRAALWAGDATLRPVASGSGELTVVDAARRRAWLAGLASVERGGATDLGALLTEAAGRLDPKRRGAILYVGDGMPSVGEVGPKELSTRLARLPASTRLFAVGVGSRANLPLLDAITRGAPVEPVADAYGAARAALRLLEAAQRAVWVSATVDLGGGVDRILPRLLPAVAADESALVVGRLSGALPTAVVLTSGDLTIRKPLRVRTIDDAGDLRRRWGLGRLQELLGEGAGRASLVDVARRYSLVSPYTSLYVPTTREVAQGDVAARVDVAEARASAVERRRWWRPWSSSAWVRRYRAEEAEIATADNADRKEGGTGTRAKGDQGSMGKPSAPGALGANVPADREQDRVESKKAPEEAARDAAQFGMIGLLATAGGGAPNAAPAASATTPTAPWANEVGGSAAAGGLGLFGVGEGGGGAGDFKSGSGAGQGIGQGFGNGHGRLGAAHAAGAPTLVAGEVKVNGRLPPEVIKRIVRQSFGRFRLCYENALTRNPTVQGTAKVKFVIDRSGVVSTAQDGGSDLPDAGAVACVVRAVGNLSFPAPEGGIVTVDYPIVFTPGDGSAPRATPPPANAPAVATGPARIGVLGHAARPCGASADLPLSERRILWTERLAGQGSAEGALATYRRALEDCEAPTWRDRTNLLLVMVDLLPSVTARVALWKSLVLTPAADVVYRAIVVRVKSVLELHELHQALGLAVVDPDLLASMLQKAKTPADRLGVLRAAATKWPDDLELGLRVLDAYEDAADDAGGRAWARRLRLRVDATAHVWTSVGEYYLRQASREKGAEADRDRTEARRTFGELVEFAPEDPAARRRLGDLLRAHGFWDEALRQYLTLQTLTPDDPTVWLLLASAAQGLGRTEEAASWAEKAAAAGSPDGTSPLSRAARATAVSFLAWARDEAVRAGKKEDAERLGARARRLIAGAGKAPGAGDVTHLLVTWSHPELHPSLWTNTLGTPMPSPDNFPTLGVAESRTTAPRGSVELRLEPDDAARAARLGLEAEVTLITAEGTANEKIVRQRVSFGTVANPTVLLVLDYDVGSIRASRRSSGEGGSARAAEKGAR